MSIITEAIKQYKSNLPEEVELIAVSKTFPIDDIKDAYTCGQRHFGENKVQELTEKATTLPTDIKWHMIGHLQTNKVKYIAPFIHLIHSVDSLKLLETINKEAIKNNRTIDVLMQIHVAQEETKFGLLPDELYQLLSNDNWHNLHNIRICGLMSVASFTDDIEQIKHEFMTVKQVFSKCKEEYFVNADYFKEISMGMTNDYTIAIDCGATLIRIGNGIFGKRYYQK